MVSMFTPCELCIHTCTNTSMHVRVPWEFCAWMQRNPANFPSEMLKFLRSLLQEHSWIKEGRPVSCRGLPFCRHSFICTVQNGPQITLMTRCSSHWSIGLRASPGRDCLYRRECQHKALQPFQCKCAQSECAQSKCVQSKCAQSKCAQNISALFITAAPVLSGPK